MIPRFALALAPLALLLACGGGGSGTGGAAPTSSHSATSSSGSGGGGGSGGSSTTSTSSNSSSGAGGSLDFPPPRAVAPLSGVTVTSQSPSFRWAASPDWDGARVEICADRDCATIVQKIVGPGTTAKALMPLGRGVYFWRLHGRKGVMTAEKASDPWELVVGALSSPIDTSFGAVFDADGDGFADTAVGSPGPGLPGRADVYAGSAASLGTAPARSLQGVDGADAGFGTAVASAGDVNGDGYADLVVGEPGYQSGAGRAFVYLGSATGLATMPGVTIETPSGTPGRFGAAITAAGDTDGDGYADVLVGAPAAEGVGRVYLYLGSATGLSSKPAAILKGADTPNEGFGLALAGATDFNGDGFPDLLVGAYNTVLLGVSPGKVHVFYGQKAGLPTSAALVLGAPGDFNGDGFGRALAAGGDVTGDGYPDVIAGAPGILGGTGRVYVFPGGMTGVGVLPSFTLQGSMNEAGSFGAALATGDVNRDGYADIVAGEPDAFMSKGRVHVFEGSATGPNNVADVYVEAPSKAMGGSFGAALAANGDLDRDGYDDVVGGAPAAASADGEAYAFRGSANATIPMAKPALKAPASGGKFGAAVAR